MATETFFLPGGGIIVDAEEGDEYIFPGYGVVVNRPSAAVVVIPTIHMAPYQTIQRRN